MSLHAKSLKCTAVLDPAAVAALDVPTDKPRFTVELQVAGLVIRATLNSKTLRRGLQMIRDQGMENVAAFMQGRLVGSELQDAAITVQPRIPAPAPPPP